MEQIENIISLLRKHLSGSLTGDEQTVLQEWAERHPAYRTLLKELSDESVLMEGYNDYLEVYDAAVTERLLEIERRLMGRLAGAPIRKRARRLTHWWPYAAAVLLLTGSFLFLRESPEESITQVDLIASEQISPGSRRAVLDMGNGQLVHLDEFQSGIRIEGGQIHYADGSLVVQAQAESQQLLLTTPRGGTYQVTLPDGSRVWLNAASTLKYPSRFTGNHRDVQLKGEAYFEIKKGQAPFRVASGGQVVEVLGTQFNISAYEDEMQIRTTLVEGRLQVGAGDRSEVLEPGEQTIFSADGLEKSQVDIRSFIAWRDGYFSLENKSLDQLMKEVSRWYDIEVVYSGAIPAVIFYGDASRDSEFTVILRLLEGAGVMYRIENGTVYIMEK